MRSAIISLLLFSIWAATAAAVTPEASCANGTSTGVTSMRVLWTVSGYIIGADASWGEQQAKRCLFKPLDISDDAITFDGEVCHPVQFERHRVVAADFLRAQWRITPQQLGIADAEVQLVKTNCELPGFSEYLHLNDNRLIVPIKGVFFIFEPVMQR